MSKIIISRSFEIISPESADTGVPFDCGVLNERMEVTFRELVSLMSTHYLCSLSPWNRDYNCKVFTSDYEPMFSADWYKKTAIEYHKENEPRLYMYWVWARKISDANS